MKIGTTEIPMITRTDSNNNVPSTELKNVHSTAPIVTTHQPDNERVTLEFVLAQELHSNDLTVQEQRAAIKDLEDNEIAANSVSYLNWSGWFAVTNVSFGQENGDPVIQEGVLEAIYLPDTDYNL